MIIPDSQDDRELFYADIIKRAFSSREDRKALYSVLKNYYLYGNANIQQTADYNKLFPHIDLLSSFLFSGETTSFVIETSEDVDNQDPILEQKKAQKLLPRLHDLWHDSNLDILFNDALNWALVYSTMIVKIVPLLNQTFAAYLVEPHNFGVLREDVPMLDHQEAMVHEYLMSETEFLRRIEKFGDEEKLRIITRVGSSFTDVAVGGDSLPMPVQKLIISSTSPNIQGQIAQLEAQYDFNPRIEERCCLAQEIWIWDDTAKDYRTVTMIEGSTLLTDHMKNIFIPEEHPFVKVTPNPMTTYFWGRTEMMYLIPIQEWINIRVQEIKRILAKIADPPMAGIGLEGVVEEKWLQNPGDRIATSIPSGNITAMYPQSPGDIFKELQMLELMFAEVSGIRELMQGKGAAGVRATSHADLLVRVGSSRVKKKAAVLEDSIEKLAGLILAFMRKYDPAHYKLDEEKITFIAKQLSPKSSVKVDSHSSSPIFIEQQMDKAAQAFKAGAIDKEDLIDAMKFQNASFMKAKLRKREAQNEVLSTIKNLVESMDGQNDAQVLEKLKGMFEGQ